MVGAPQAQAQGAHLRRLQIGVAGGGGSGGATTVAGNQGVERLPRDIGPHAEELCVEAEPDLPHCWKGGDGVLHLPLLRFAASTLLLPSFLPVGRRAVAGAPSAEEHLAHFRVFAEELLDCLYDWLVLLSQRRRRGDLLKHWLDGAAELVPHLPGRVALQGRPVALGRRHKIAMRRQQHHQAHVRKTDLEWLRGGMEAGADPGHGQPAGQNVPAVLHDPLHLAAAEGQQGRHHLAAVGQHLWLLLQEGVEGLELLQ
mmetsp:Transcript_30381/g.85837  ORF Transcript_30381/g.85837 Transcript_30381/m.85837 type:complete len:256 (+) Transcript_30381:1855-2622(+)